MSSIAKTGATPENLNRPFDQKQLIELWQYFEGAGNSAKAQMTSMATWLLTIAGGVLSYVVADTLELSRSAPRAPRQPFSARCWGSRSAPSIW